MSDKHSRRGLVLGFCAALIGFFTGKRLSAAPLPQRPLPAPAPAPATNPGHVTYRYDHAGRSVTIIDPASPVTTTVYDAWGNKLG
jgi:YD repeat-containing protein